MTKYNEKRNVAGTVFEQGIQMEQNIGSNR